MSKAAYDISKPMGRHPLRVQFRVTCYALGAVAMLGAALFYSPFAFVGVLLFLLIVPRG